MSDKLSTFLDLISWSEGTSTSPHTRNDGYDIIVGGIDSPNTFTDYSKHPFEDGGFVRVNSRLDSTASGRYQLLARYWRVYKVQLHLPDFSPASQDAVAIQQIRERHALPLIETGDIAGAISACSNIWASLPGNNYQQGGGHKMETLVSRYNAALAESPSEPGPVVV
jgi:muramidase (phage lysozyme)